MKRNDGKERRILKELRKKKFRIDGGITKKMGNVKGKKRKSNKIRGGKGGMGGDIIFVGI